MEKINSRFSFSCVLPSVLVLLLIFIFSFDVRADAPSTTIVKLNGTAQGGVVSIMEILPIDAGYVSVVATQGESAEAVLNRLADQVCSSSVFNWRIPLQPRPSFIKVTGNTLALPLSGLKYCFSGTDVGFVSIKPVLSVSGTYDTAKHQVRLCWINPPDKYDSIEVGNQKLPPDTTNCVYEYEPNRISFGLVSGKKGDAHSPPASIIIHSDSQEELDTFPFYMGLAPNWSYWSDSTNADLVKCDQGIKTDVDMSVRGDPWDKPLYQLIKTTQADVSGGVWRKFLGLTPGHNYQVEVRMNTFKMDDCTNAWEFSFHAAADNSNGMTLTAEQMAGAAALPDGSKGLAAGRVIAYGPGRTTKGQWKKSSIDPLAASPEAKNITLPQGVTSITVWFRHSGANSTGVGTDWIKLTDVTPSKK